MLRRGQMESCFVFCEFLPGPLGCERHTEGRCLEKFIKHVRLTALPLERCEFLGGVGVSLLRLVSPSIKTAPHLVSREQEGSLDFSLSSAPFRKVCLSMGAYQFKRDGPRWQKDKKENTKLRRESATKKRNKR